MSEQLPFKTIEGTPELDLSEVRTIFVPGRGRSADGMNLSQRAIERVDTAAQLYHALDQVTYVAVSGYKTPAENKGELWSCHDNPQPDEMYIGVPEAYSARAMLLERGVPDYHIAVEPNSIDSVTNIAYCEADATFGPLDEPVAIVAQRQHLNRIMTLIAPKILRHPYMGVIVPETQPDVDPLTSRLATRLIMTGVAHDDPNVVARRAHRNARAVWALASLFRTRYST